MNEFEELLKFIPNDYIADVPTVKMIPVRTAPKETKNIVEVTENEKIEVINFENGIAYRSKTLLPAIYDVSVINNSVVVMTFSDNTQEKAVLSGDDTFSIEQGISICITKKILSFITHGNGSSIYNKLVEMGLSVYNDKLAAIEKKKKEDAEEAERKAKRFAKAQKRKAKRAEKIKAEQEAVREEQIEIQKEAYLRAMHEYMGCDTPVETAD